MKKGKPLDDVCWECGTVCEAWLPDGLSLDDCVKLWTSNDRAFCGGFRTGSKVFLARLTSRDPAPWNAQHCFTGISVGVQIKEIAIFVAVSDWTAKYKYPPDAIQGLQIVKTFGIDGNMSGLCTGVLYAKSQEDILPKDLPWCYCEVYSKMENCLLEDTMSPSTQLRAGQGTSAFNEVNKHTLLNRSEALRYPVLKTPHQVAAVEKLVNDHRDLLETQRLADERHAKGEGVEDPDHDEFEDDGPKSFRPAGIAMLGTSVEKRKGASNAQAAYGRGRGRSPVSVGADRRIGNGTPRKAMNAPPREAPHLASPATASCRIGGGSSVKGDVGQEEWEKVSPQGVLDGTEVVGKRLNGVARFVLGVSNIIHMSVASCCDKSKHCISYVRILSRSEILARKLH